MSLLSHGHYIFYYACGHVDSQCDCDGVAKPRINLKSYCDKCKPKDKPPEEYDSTRHKL